VSRGHSKNRLFNVWLSEEDYHKFEEFLDKFSVGEMFSDQRALTNAHLFETS
jgi:deoxyhypusine synthase